MSDNTWAHSPASYGVPLHRNPTPDVVPIAVIEVSIIGQFKSRHWERLVLPGEDPGEEAAKIALEYDAPPCDIWADTIGSMTISRFKGDTEAERLKCYQRWHNCYYFGDVPTGPWI